MALTKIGKEGITGISNASDATAITITSGENVGIGETASANLLHVKASDTGIAPHASAQIVLEREGTNYLQFLTAENGTSGCLFGDGSDVDVGKIVYDHNIPAMQFQVETAEAMRIVADGKIGIGTSSPECMLHLSGGNEEAKIKFQVGTANADKFKIYASTAGRLYVNSDNGSTGVYLTHNGTSWTSNSDETLKDNITSLGTVGDKLKNYRTSYFNWKADTDKPPKRNIGFIAQDWETDFPEVVTKKEGETLGMQYTETIPILLKYIQELEARITALEA